MLPEEFRRAGHAAIEWIADYRARLAELPVRSNLEPGQFRRELPATTTRDGEPFDAIARDFDRLLPSRTHSRRELEAPATMV